MSDTMRLDTFSFLAVSLLAAIMTVWAIIRLPTRNDEITDRIGVVIVIGAGAVLAVGGFILFLGGIIVMMNAPNCVDVPLLQSCHGTPHGEKEIIGFLRGAWALGGLILWVCITLRMWRRPRRQDPTDS